MSTIAEPTITCPKCKAEIRLTESLAAPLIEATRLQFEEKIAEKDQEIAAREQSLHAKEKQVQDDKRALEDKVAEQVASQLSVARTRIIEEEARKAKLASAGELETKARELADLQDLVKDRDEKLASAQKEQAELLKKQRELDDAKRELELTVEKRVQDGVATVRDQARKDAEAAYLLKSSEKDQTIASMQQSLDEAKLKGEQMAQQEKELHDKEKQLADEKRALEQQVVDQVATQLASERTQLIEDERRKAKAASALELQNKERELAELQETLNVRNEKLAEAQKEQVELLKKQRELDDAKRELELTVEKRVQDNLAEVRAQAKKEVEDSERFKLAEREQKIASMQRTIEELQRKAEQGSQQTQGEVQELAIENMLRDKFPYDTIEPVPKGEFGGDTIQRVVSSAGVVAGTILWESKRTKNWSNGWLSKLRDDQRTAKAEISVLISQALPDGVETFELIDGVWVAHPRVITPIAMMLRNTLIEVNNARLTNEGQQTKAEMVYQYLTGPRYRQRVEAIVEAFSSMQEDLDKERKVITKQWAKRQEQIERVMGSTVGMYGDLQGIAGKSIQEIEGLELPALGAGTPGSEDL
jgi:hypothetical protein